VLEPDEFDDIEFQAARTGNHVRAAVRMTQLAAAAAQEGQFADGMSVAEAHLRAGEQWLMADDPKAAAAEFTRAIADGGPTFADPRVFLARALLTMDQPAEAAPIIAALEAQRDQVNPRTCDLLAELYTDRGDLVTALDWANCGVERCMATGDKAELRLLLRLRYRIRNDLGLPEDEYDLLLDDRRGA
jgi:Tfp pilus assembly protein PilX